MDDIKRRLRAALTDLESLRRLEERVLLVVGHQHALSSRSPDCPDLRSAEFKVFSQFGEDGIIQYLLSRVDIQNEIFIEIGVQDYREANTRFLLMHDNWEGLIVDADDRHLRPRVNDDLVWRHTLHRIQAFVTRDNVNTILSTPGFASDIGLLSLDIDGTDYWVLEALDAVRPRILVTEYNSLFGKDRAVTVPYVDSFSRFDAHYSGLYWGASITAFANLARSKGYKLIGSNSAGNNAFFVRDDVRGGLPVVKPEDAWVQNRYRDARHPDGQLSYLSGHERQREVIARLPLIDIETGQQILVRDL